MIGKVNSIMALAASVLLIAAVAIILRGPPEYNRTWHAPEVELRESLTGGLDYSIIVTRTSPAFSLEDTKIYLFDPEGQEVESHFIGLQADEQGVWHGIDITWDNQTDNRSEIYYGEYEDPVAAQARIDRVKNGSCPEGPIHLSFFDWDKNGRISPGDRIYLDRHQEGGFYSYGDYTIRLKFYSNFLEEPTWGVSLKLTVYLDFKLTAKKVDKTNHTIVIQAQNWWLIDRQLSVSLLDPEKNLVRSHVIGLREGESGNWVGIYTNYNDTQIAYMSDPEAARTRLDQVKNGSDSEGPIYMWYTGRLEVHPVENGDIESFDNYWVRATFIPTGETLGEVQLKP